MIWMLAAQAQATPLSGFELELIAVFIHASFL
jgi:hypothetical protein